VLAASQGVALNNQTINKPKWIRNGF
jgi:hypothetical protein